MGIPLPAATQWDLVQAAAKTLAPAHEELLHQAAQATVLYNDDTTMKVLQLTRKQRAAALADDADGERTGIFTSGIVATDTGTADRAVLHRRAPCRGEPRRGARPPHARPARPDPDVRWPLAQRPERVRHRPGLLPRPCPPKVCGTGRDASRPKCASCSKPCARCISPMPVPATRAWTPRSACNCTRTKAQPRMAALEQWMQRQFDRTRHRAELLPRRGDPLHAKAVGGTDAVPAGGRGARWTTTSCERALKKAILHRKNALVLSNPRRRSRRRRLHEPDPHRRAEPHRAVRLSPRPAAPRRRTSQPIPADWMPWTYQATLARSNAGPSPPF